VRLSLIGRHQGANAAVALATIEQLRRSGWNLPEPAIRSGLSRLNWPARVEIVRRQPTVVVDVAHNVASVEALLDVLQESFQSRRRYLIFATTKDKDIRGMLNRLLPAFDRTVLTQYFNNPRGESVEAVAALAEEQYRNRYEMAADIQSAWSRIQQAAQPGDLICVAGSFFLAAEFREMMRSSCGGTSCATPATAMTS
jgi:dihydrofolate synthase/folylpolyglutamate synthase